MVDILIFLSIVAWVATLLLINSAAAGIAMAAFALWFALLARIQQAEKQHRKLMDALAAQGKS